MRLGFLLRSEDADRPRRDSRGEGHQNASTSHRDLPQPFFGPLNSRLSRARACLASTSDRKSTRLNSSHLVISYAVFCLKKKKSYSSPTPRVQVGHTETVSPHAVP